MASKRLYIALGFRKGRNPRPWRCCELKQGSGFVHVYSFSSFASYGTLAHECGGCGQDGCPTGGTRAFEHEEWGFVPWGGLNTWEAWIESLKALSNGRAVLWGLGLCWAGRRASEPPERREGLEERWREERW